MNEDTGKGKRREATVAGVFYPEGPEELGARVAALLGAARPPFFDARCIISPHAGLEYSGDLAALAWKAASGLAPKTVVIVAPLHRAEEQLVYLPESDFFDCPLGPALVDHRIVEELHDCGTNFSVNDIPHLEEHGIEVQLPFMRTLFPDATLVPVIMGKPSLATVKSLSAALGIVVGPLAEDCLVVLSTNMASGSDEAIVHRFTDRLVETIARGEPEALLKAGLDQRGPTCGAGCLAAYLASALAIGMEAHVLGRHDSTRSRQSGDEQLVEYLAAAFVPRGRS